MNEQLDLRDEKMIDCLGLINLYFEKRPTEDKELFKKDDAALQGFLDSLIDHPSVVAACPENINFLFKDLGYAESLAKVEFAEFNIITNDDAGWILVRVKRQVANV